MVTVSQNELGDRGPHFCGGQRALDDASECLLEQRRAYEDSLTCRLGGNTNEPKLEIGTSRAALDLRCRLGGPSKPGSGQPPSKPSSQQEKKVSELTPAQKNALDKAVKDANQSIDNILKDPQKLTDLTKKLNDVINHMNQNPKQFPEAGSITPVTEKDVRTALQAGQKAAVIGILPASHKSQGENEGGKVKVMRGYSTVNTLIRRVKR